MGSFVSHNAANESSSHLHIYPNVRSIYSGLFLFVCVCGLDILRFEEENNKEIYAYLVNALVGIWAKSKMA